MKLIRYSSALQIKLLSVFNQTENNHIFFTEIETIKCCRLTDENVQKHDSLIDENV